MLSQRCAALARAEWMWKAKVEVWSGRELRGAWFGQGDGLGQNTHVVLARSEKMHPKCTPTVLTPPSISFIFWELFTWL